MDNININQIVPQDYRFELTSDNFNRVISDVNTTLVLIVDKVNEIIGATNGVWPASAINYDPSSVPWLNALGITDMEQAIDSIGNYLNNGVPVYTTGIEKNHNSIDHTNVSGVPQVVQADYDELVSGTNTEQHRHDTMYLTKTELSNMGVSSSTLIKEYYFESSWEYLDQTTNVLNINHGLDARCDGVEIYFSENSDGTGNLQALTPGCWVGSSFVGFSIRYDNNNINVTAGDFLFKDGLNEYTQGYIKIIAYRFK